MAQQQRYGGAKRGAACCAPILHLDLWPQTQRMAPPAEMSWPKSTRRRKNDTDNHSVVDGFEDEWRLLRHFRAACERGRTVKVGLDQRAGVDGEFGQREAESSAEHDRRTAVLVGEAVVPHRCRSVHGQDAPLPVHAAGAAHRGLVGPRDLAVALHARRVPAQAGAAQQGIVNEKGHIECPYHGWTFEGEGGQCMSIPQKPKSQPIQVKACGWAFPTAVKQGLLWVYAEPLPPDCSWYNTCTSIPSMRTIPSCEALDDPDFVAMDMFRDLPYDASILLENLLDSSHLHFVHHKTVSNKARASPMSFVMTDPLDQRRGFNATWELKSVDEPDTPSPAKPSGGSVDMFDMVDMAPEPEDAKPKQLPRYTQFRPPSYMHHIVQQEGLEAWTVGYAVPIRPGQARLIARFPFKFDAKLPKFLIKYYPAWLQHIGQHKVLEDDNILLHIQERALVAASQANPATGMRPNGIQPAPAPALSAWKSVYHTPTAADTIVGHYRRWLTSAGPAPWRQGTEMALGNEMSREQLLDRYHSHTKNCKACMGALTGIRRARFAFASLALALPTVVKLALVGGVGQGLGAGLLGGSLLAAGLWYWLGGFEVQLLRGSWPPPRNRKD
eukprot:CAMPEP_0177696784 /NCGR_PEP_ID=MMETSP0484_2-20121128/4164_1 /TAXON_ID=354590 /ORGANISM="Rhodomonas lens, Strain RHODO" /LENGTH=611 /DNA_ID=CAMNT_0019207777 /DNA_START=123 /DNA_END=1959 /DNA_ORIENTATION=-